MLQFCSCKYLLIPQSQKRLSKKSCGCYNMVHQWPIEVESIISPMGSSFRVSSGHSTTCCRLSGDLPVTGAIIAFLCLPIVVVVLVLVHPDLGKADAVLPEHVDAWPPLVGRPFAEDVTNVGTGNDLKRASAHPSLQSNKKENCYDVKGLSRTLARLSTFS